MHRLNSNSTSRPINLNSTNFEMLNFKSNSLIYKAIPTHRTLNSYSKKNITSSSSTFWSSQTLASITTPLYVNPIQIYDIFITFFINIYQHFEIYWAVPNRKKWLDLLQRESEVCAKAPPNGNHGRKLNQRTVHAFWVFKDQRSITAFNNSTRKIDVLS